jgi:hypothetical protein
MGLGKHLKNVAIATFVSGAIGTGIWASLQPEQHNLITIGRPVFKDSDTEFVGKQASAYEGYDLALRQYLRFFDEQSDGSLDGVDYTDSEGIKRTFFIGGTESHQFSYMWQQILEHERDADMSGFQLREKEIKLH